MSKEDEEKIEKKWVREVRETSIRQVQNVLQTETGKAVCREAMQKYLKVPTKPFKTDDSAFPVGRSQGQALEVVHGYEAPESGRCRRSLSK